MAQFPQVSQYVVPVSKDAQYQDLLLVEYSQH